MVFALLARKTFLDILYIFLKSDVKPSHSKNFFPRLLHFIFESVRIQEIHKNVFGI